MRAKAARTATCALDLELRWGDGELLASDHFGEGTRYVLRDSAVANGEAGYVVQRAWLQARDGAQDADFVLVSMEHELATVSHVGGAQQTLRLGEQTHVHVGPLVFRLAVVEPRVASAQPWSQLMQPRDHAWTLASLGMHALALGCMMLMPPRASSLSLDLMSEDPRFARYLSTPITREEEPPPWTANDDKPADDAGKKHAGEDGAAGKPDAPKLDRRMGIQGKSDKRVPSHKPTASEVRQAGLLGALAMASLQLGPSSPLGADTALGYDPVSAIGKLFGAQVGASEGFNGLGLKHAGRGGGGDATDTVGVGDLGTSEGARRSLGAHGSLLGRKARLPVLRSEPAEIRGALSKEAIRRAIHLRLNEVRYCYETGLAADPQLSGRLAVSFLITPSGAVQQASVSQSTLSSRTVADCVARAVRRFSFPAPDGGGYVQVTYPFSFSAD